MARKILNIKKTIPMLERRFKVESSRKVFSYTHLKEQLHTRYSLDITYETCDKLFSTIFYESNNIHLKKCLNVIKLLSLFHKVNIFIRKESSTHLDHYTLMFKGFYIYLYNNQIQVFDEENELYQFGSLKRFYEVTLLPALKDNVEKTLGFSIKSEKEITPDCMSLIEKVLF